MRIAFENEVMDGPGGSISKEGVAITSFARGRNPEGGQIMGRARKSSRERIFEIKKLKGTE